MIVTIGHVIRIRQADPRNWDLEVYNPRQVQLLADPWQLLGHYGSLPDALDGLFRRHTQHLTPEARLDAKALADTLKEVLASIPKAVEEGTRNASRLVPASGVKGKRRLDRGRRSS